jgi:hypothetical protein
MSGRVATAASEEHLIRCPSFRRTRAQNRQPIRASADFWTFRNSGTCSRTKSFISGEPNFSKKRTRARPLPSDEYVGLALGLQKYDLNDELKLNDNQAFNRQNSEAYFINCWQIYEGETLEMWKTYGNGVAVFSRFELLKTALSIMLDDILVAIVR